MAATYVECGGVPPLLRNRERFSLGYDADLGAASTVRTSTTQAKPSAANDVFVLKTRIANSSLFALLMSLRFPTLAAIALHCLHVPDSS